MLNHLLFWNIYFTAVPLQEHANISCLLWTSRTGPIKFHLLGEISESYLILELKKNTKQQTQRPKNMEERRHGNTHLWLHISYDVILVMTLLSSTSHHRLCVFGLNTTLVRKKEYCCLKRKDCRWIWKERRSQMDKWIWQIEIWKQLQQQNIKNRNYGSRR